MGYGVYCFLKLIHCFLFLENHLIKITHCPVCQEKITTSRESSTNFADKDLSVVETGRYEEKWGEEEERRRKKKDEEERTKKLSDLFC